jgi:hypothetical protein
LLDALYHGYVVVRYPPALAGVVERDLRGAVDQLSGWIGRARPQAVRP